MNPELSTLSHSDSAFHDDKTCVSLFLKIFVNLCTNFAFGFILDIYMCSSNLALNVFKISRSTNIFLMDFNYDTPDGFFMSMYKKTSFRDSLLRIHFIGEDGLHHDFMCR